MGLNNHTPTVTAQYSTVPSRNSPSSNVRCRDVIAYRMPRTCAPSPLANFIQPGMPNPEPSPPDPGLFVEKSKENVKIKEIKCALANFDFDVITADNHQRRVLYYLVERKPPL